MATATERTEALERQAQRASDQVREVKEDNKRLKNENLELKAQLNSRSERLEDYDRLSTEVKSLRAELEVSQKSLETCERNLAFEKAAADAGRAVASGLKRLSS